VVKIAQRGSVERSNSIKLDLVNLLDLVKLAVNGRRRDASQPG
jgi:hypothetical protein